MSHKPTDPPNDLPDQDNAVGYGRPPKSGQFKPGKSGNPRGRPKGTKSLDVLVNTLLNRKILISDDRGQRRVTRREAIAMRMVEQAMKGDLKALQTVLSLEAHRSQLTEPVDADSPLSPVEADLLSQFVQQLAPTEPSRDLQPSVATDTAQHEGGAPS